MSADATPSRRARASLGRMASRTALRSATPLGRSLEIGDLVRLEGSDLVGVLRYSGPVHGRSGTFAGLELIGDSAGRGKNDGTVDGVQYFATAPLNGVFGPLARVVPISDARPQSATARPRSALSRPSSRAAEHERPPSRRAPTPTRPTSARAMRPPSTPNTHTAPMPRTVPRRSMAFGTPRAPSPEKRATPVRRPQSALRSHLARSVDHHAPSTSASAGARAADHKELLEQMNLAPTLPDASPELDALDGDDALDDVSVDAPPPAAAAAAAAAAPLTEADREALDALRLELADERRRRRDAAQREATLATSASEAEKKAADALAAHAALEQRAADLAAEKDASLTRVLDLEAALEAACLREKPRDDENDSSELAQLHTKVEQMIAAWNRERADLTGRIDELTNAGRETISVYEAQIASSGAEHDALRARLAELESRDDSAAAAVHEDAAHLQTKVERLEDELAEVRARLEAHAAAEQRSAAAHASAEERLTAEIRARDERLREADAAAAAAAEEAAALRTALAESSAALERERAELEALRAERLGGTVAVPSVSPQPAADTDTSSVDELRARIATLERENAAQREQAQRDIGELEALVEARIFKEEELENEMERLRIECDAARGA